MPASGYWFSVAADRKGGPVGWRLTSSHPEFVTRTEMLGVENFAHRGASWSTSSIVAFPNQVDAFRLNEAEAAASAPAGVQVMDTKLTGTRDKRSLEIAFAVRVRTEEAEANPHPATFVLECVVAEADGRGEGR